MIVRLRCTRNKILTGRSNTFVWVAKIYKYYREAKTKFGIHLWLLLSLYFKGISFSSSETAFGVEVLIQKLTEGLCKYV
jgi:hypothetical protein